MFTFRIYPLRVPWSNNINKQNCTNVNFRVERKMKPANFYVKSKTEVMFEVKEFKFER